MIGTRGIAVLGLAVSISACAAPAHEVDQGDTILRGNMPATLGDQILQEGQGDGCLVAGNAGDNRATSLPGFHNSCRDLRDVIAPPEPPVAVPSPSR